MLPVYINVQASTSQKRLCWWWEKKRKQIKITKTMNNPHHLSDHFASVVECNLNENITYSLRLVRDFDEKCVSINVINHSDISIWWFWVFWVWYLSLASYVFKSWTIGWWQGGFWRNEINYICLCFVQRLRKYCTHT